MQSDKKIRAAFFLNLMFSIIECVGGLWTGSVAILSDALHDFGDSISIGISYFLEKTSQKEPDNQHTYGYRRYSVLGSVITTVILLFGSLAVLYHAVPRIFRPVPVNYDGVLALAVMGVLINFLAAYFTKEKDSLNQRAVNLHMLEDVLGWLAVLVGAVCMKIWDAPWIDPLLSAGVAVFIFVHAAKTLKSAIDIFLEKTPANISAAKIREIALGVDGVLDAHHIHIRTLDGYLHYATLHVVTDAAPKEIKHRIKEALSACGISHTTIEIETSEEGCDDVFCKTDTSRPHHEHHHHHH